MWKNKKLYELCDIQSGLWTGKNEPFTKALVLRNTNFTAAGTFDYSDVVELEVETKQLANREVIKNDIILEKSGGGDKTPVGRVCIHDAEADIPYSLSNFTARIRVMDEGELDARFLHKFLYFLYISGKTESMQRHSTGIRNLQLSQYKEIDVPLPPLAEQQRIVAKLDGAFAEIDRAIELAEAKEAEVDNLKASLLTASLKDDAGMWRMMKLGDACEILDSLRKPITKKFRAEGDVPYYGATGIVDWVADYIFDEKLVLVGEDGAKWGSGDKTAFVVEGKTWVNNHAHVLRPRAELVTHEWIAYYLTSIDLSPWVTGLTVPKLNQAQLRSIPIPLPPLAEQQHIVAKLDAAFAEIDTANASIASQRSNYSALKSAILTQELQPSEAA